MLRATAACAVLLALSCGGENDTPETTSTAPVSLQIRDATVNDAVERVAAATGRAIVVDAGAVYFARCARVTLVAPAPLPPETLIEMLGEAIEPSGLRLDRSGDVVVVRHEPGARPPPDCLSAVSEERRPLADVLSPPPRVAAAREEAGIVRETEHTFTITRALRDDLVARDDDSVRRWARAVPVMDDHRSPDGVRLHGVHRTSIPGLLGIENGDTIHEVNGLSVRSGDDLLGLRPHLSRVDEVTVRATRRGQPIELRYRVLDP